jgi:hypothetical protein
MHINIKTNNTYTHTYTHIHTHTCTHKTHRHTLTFAQHTNTHTHTYTQTCTHTHTLAIESTTPQYVHLTPCLQLVLKRSIYTSANSSRAYNKASCVLLSNLQLKLRASIWRLTTPPLLIICCTPLPPQPTTC